MPWEEADSASSHDMEKKINDTKEGMVANMAKRRALMVSAGKCNEKIGALRRWCLW